MKRILLPIAFLVCFAASALAQSSPPIVVTEIDGSPTVYGVTKVVVSNGTLTVSGTTATIVTGGGGGSGCTPPGTANRVLYDNGAGGCTSSAAFTFSGAKATLGVAGSSVGAIGFNNATSGQITLQPVTGALGTVTLSLPAATGTLLYGGGPLGTPSSGTLTNATGLPIASGVSGLGTGVATALAVNVGSAGAFVAFDGALGTPSSGTLTNATGLPPATGIVGWPANASGCLSNNGSGTLSWAACSGGSSGITIGTTTITSGTATRLLYETSSNVVGEISGFTSDGTNVTAGSGNLRATSPRITTGINDANGNSMLTFSPTASAVNYFQLTNSATATTAINTLEVAGTDTNVSLYLKVKGSDVTNGGQILVDDSRRYDRPMFARKDSPTLGWGFKAGGAWWSVNAPNIMLGAGDGTPGLVGITGNSYLAWNVNDTAAEDCPACVALGLNRVAQRVIGVVGADSTPDGDLTNGATFGFIATTPSQLTADQNNYDPTYTSYFQRWSSDASRTVTGLTFAISTKVSGQMHRIWNVGSNNIVLANESASSTAANRFTVSTGADLTLGANECADAQYDAATSRWRVTPCATAGGGSGTVTSVAQSFTGGLISVGGSPVTTSGTLALTVAGTSGGIPYFSSASTWASSAALTANLPVIGGGAGAAPSVGTVSGNTTTFVTTTGAQTSGRCVEIDASGNHVASSGACGGSGSQTPWTSNIDADGFNLLMDDSTGILSSETSNPQILLFSSVASAVNELTITNAATGNRPNIAASGDDTNIGITVTPKGTGATVLASGNLNFGGVAAGNLAFIPNGTGGAFRRGDDSNLSGEIFGGSFVAGTSGARKAMVDAGNTAPGIFMSSDSTFYFANSTNATTNINDLSLVRAGTNTLRVGRGTTAGVGFVNMGRLVTAKTSGYSVVVNDSNTFFTNTGAGGSVTFTLPTPVVGMMYEFYRDANQTVVIDVGAGVTIQVGASTTTSGGDVTLDAVGSSIRITAISTTQWVGSSVGTLTFN